MVELQNFYSIGLFSSSERNKDTQLNVQVSDKHIKIDLFAAYFEDSPDLLQEYLRHVKRQEPEYIPNEADEDGEFDDPLEEMHDWVLTPFLPIFRDIPPLMPNRQYTIEDCLYADELHYTVRVENDKLVAVYLGKSDKKRNQHMGTQLHDSARVDHSVFPRYHPCKIHVTIEPDSASLPAIPRKVIIESRSEPSFFKMVYGNDERTTARELDAYSKIHAAKFDDSVRTSRLHGLVQDDDGYIMGLLLSYIDCQGATLYSIDGSDPKYFELRQKWFDQISHTLEHLHSHNIFWGDAKAANVLIDVNENAYVIDFGGGYTKGWVKKEERNSIKGDIQGLESIKRYLFE